VLIGCTEPHVVFCVLIGYSMCVLIGCTEPHIVFCVLIGYSIVFVDWLYRASHSVVPKTSVFCPAAAAATTAGSEACVTLVRW